MLTGSQILAALLPIFAQYGATGIRDIISLIEGNPQQQGETDAAYIERTGGLIDANVQKVVAGDAVVQGEDPTDATTQPTQVPANPAPGQGTPTST